MQGVAALAPLTTRPLIEQTGGSGVQSCTSAGCSAGAELRGAPEVPDCVGKQVQAGGPNRQVEAQEADEAATAGKVYCSPVGTSPSRGIH